MKILEYNEVNPFQVMGATLLALDFPLTPERVAHIRRTDPRPFPFFSVNAVENDMVLGQVGVFRLPFVSIEGRRDVGGVWAVSTHPEHSSRGVASCLLEEAHARMREAGLWFSTLGTERSRRAYKLYCRHGYVDMNVWATALATREIARQQTGLRATPVPSEGYDFLEGLFANLARDYLGFAWRHTPFARLRERVSLEDIWIVRDGDDPVGYIFVNGDDLLGRLSVQILRPDINAAQAVASVVQHLEASYIQVTVSRPADIHSLERSGFKVAHPNWGAFMVKPLVRGVTIEDARRLFGFGTDRFLISWLDTT